MSNQPYRDASPGGNGSPRGSHAVDYELQDYYDDTGIPVSSVFYASNGLVVAVSNGAVC